MNKSNRTIAGLILALLIIFAGCSQNESQSPEQDTEQNENASENAQSEGEEIVAANGFVFERGERNLELQAENDFNPFLESNEKVLAIFYATWCGYCQELDTRIPDLLAQMDDVVVINVDIEKFLALGNAYQAVATPTVVYFEQGKDPRGFRGALPTEMIVEFIEKE